MTRGGEVHGEKRFPKLDMYWDLEHAKARRAARTVAHGVSHGCGVALDFEPWKGDQSRPRWGWYWGKTQDVLPAPPGLEMDGHDPAIFRLFFSSQRLGVNFIPSN